VKPAAPDSCNGVIPLRVLVALLLCGLLPLFAFGTAPAWWADRGVLTNASPSDYAPANHGQLKNIAKAAVAEMDAELPGGAGDALHNLISGWPTPSAQTNDFAPLNIGQLKAVAKPFYDRLIAARYTDVYPWTLAVTASDDYAVANVGQVKQLFGFDLLATDSSHDADQNGLPDWWENYYFSHVGIDPNAPAPRGDGLTNLQAFQQHANPVDFYDGSTPVLTIVSGNDQQSRPGTVVSVPLVVRLTDSAGNPLVYAPVRFSVEAGGGGLVDAVGGQASPFRDARTAADGTTGLLYLQPASANVTSHITASAGPPGSVSVVDFTISTTAGVANPVISVTPNSVTSVLNPGDSSSLPVIVTNNSHDPQQFTATLVGGSTKVTFADSRQAGGPAFVWNDISATGIHLDSLSNSDDGYEALTLAFDFPFFGQTYRSVYVGSNGYVTFGSGSPSNNSAPLPGTVMPGNIIAAFASDLDLSRSGDVYYEQQTDRLVVQFSNVARFAGDGLATFQIVLKSDGTILLYYSELVGTVNQATVGVQNATRDVGLTIASNEDYLSSGLAVEILNAQYAQTSLAAEPGTFGRPSYSDSDQPNGPAYIWDDITATGTHLDSVSNIDDGFQSFNISFDFPYFGQNYHTVYVSSNGFITFGPGSSDFRTYQLPNPAAPANMIAELESDLNLAASGDVYYKEAADKVIVQFSNVARYNGDGFATFQIVLQRDGGILLYYHDVSGNASFSTVGMQDSTRTNGITVAVNRPYLKNNFAIRLASSTRWLSLSPASAIVPADGAAGINLVLDAQSLPTATYGAIIRVTTLSAPEQMIDIPVTMRINSGPDVALTSAVGSGEYIEGGNLTV